MNPSTLLVACLCAGWCDTCAVYGPLFVQVAKEHPDARFVWIDIEDHSDALGDAPELDNFPTVLIASGETLHFLGTVLPHAQTLSRLIGAASAGELTVGTPTAAQRALAAAVGCLAPRLPAV